MPSGRVSGRARRKGAVDEALILLAEAILFAGLLILSARLWASRENPYPKLAAELINATPPDAEVFIVFPEPVRIEPGRVCYAGECYSAPVQYVKGQAWWWAKAYKGSAYVAAQSGSSGGGVEPGLNATLVVQLTRLDYRDQSIGPAPAGIPVTIDGVTYYTDANGQVKVSLWRATHIIQVPSTFTFNNGWARGDFAYWSTGNATTSIFYDLRGDAVLTVYYRDWRLVKVTYTAGGYVAVGGQPVPSGWTGWYRYGTQLTLQGFPSNNWPKTRWLKGANGATPAFWQDAAQATLTVDNGYWVHARFFAVLQVSAKDDFNAAVNAPVSYSGDASGSGTTPFTLEYAGDDDGLQAKLDAQDYIDMPTYGLQVQYWLYNSQQLSDPLSVSVPPGQTHTAVAVYKRVPKPAYLNVYAVNEAGGGERVEISYSGDLTGSQNTPFQLVVYQLDGLQVTLTAPQKVDTGSYYLTFARWVYQGQSYYSTSISVSVPPTQTHNATAVYTRSGLITVQVYRVDAGGSSLGAASGVQVKIDGAVYTTDSTGVARVEVALGSHTVEILTTYFNGGWGRFTFWKWGDGSTQNPRTIAVSGHVSLTAYVYDERLLKVSWTPDNAGYVKVNGAQVSNGWTSWFRYGTSLTLEAVRNTGWQFQKWQRGANGAAPTDWSTSNPVTAAVDSGYEFRAVFAVKYVTLTVYVERYGASGSLGAAGGAQVAIDGVTYTAGSDGKVSVQVQEGTSHTVQIPQTTFNGGWARYTFYQWSDGSTQNPRTITVSADTTVTARVYDERLVKVTWEPSNGGYVTVNNQQVSNGWTNWYRYGAQVTLQAVRSTGYQFTKWQRGTNGGSLSDWSTSNPVTLTVDNGYEAHAVFAIYYVTFTVQVERYGASGYLGAASGVQVSINGATYTTGSGGSVSVQVQEGSTATVQILTTLFNSGWARYTFYQWSDGSTQNPRSFTVSSDTTVTARVYDERLLKVTWEGSGSVSVNGQSVSNGWTGWFTYGSSVTLQASPASGWRFVKWQRGTNGGSLSDWSTSNPVTLTVDNGYEAHAVFQNIVVFTVQLYAVDANGNTINPAANVQVTINGVAYTTDSNGKVQVQGQPGTYTVQIQQTYFNSNWGRYTFWKWDDGSTSNPRSFTVNQDTTATAYVYDERLLKVTYGSGGYVKVNGQQVSSGWTSWFRYGSSVALEAVPNSGYVLQKWQRAADGGSLTDYSVRVKETLSKSGSSDSGSVCTQRAYTGYAEASMSYSVSPSLQGGWWVARIEAWKCLYWGCPSRILTSRQGYGSASGTLTWSGQLDGEYVCFFVGIPFTGSYSISGTVVKPADNPITAYMSSGWWYNAVFGSP